MSTNVAIVGIATELPSGHYSDRNFDHKSFFEFLLNNGKAYERIPPSRFNIDTWKGGGLGQISTEKGAFLKNVDMFDNLEFGISAQDARNMAPSTRKLLENCFLALLDSGIDYRSRNVGCYTSGIIWDLTSVSDPDEYDVRGSFAGYPAMIANRVSSHLDLLGPSVPTDTACSSSLTALHLAVQAVQNGECEAAVVGGCQLNHRFIDWFQYSQGSLLAKDGECKPFDASADGFSRGEGAVAVVIKPLAHALRDHDRIYATILGSAINSAGSAAPPGAPVAEAQCDAMKRAYKAAGRVPQNAAYVECHATGTAKGDPTEANWVGKSFWRQEELLVGSVKGNIGHLEITAFLASLSKVLSIFEHGVIPPNVNFTTRNPAIRWDEYKLKVPTEPTPLPRHSDGKSLISMASSGIGGSNGHIVLESPPQTQPTEAQLGSNGPILLMAAGLSPRSTSAVAGSIEDLVQDTSLPVVSTILGRRSKQMTWRSFSIVDPSTLPLAPPKFSQPTLGLRTVPPIVFVFSGQGPQHVLMGRELFSIFPVFRDSVLEMDKIFKKCTGKSITKDYGLFVASSTTIALPDPWPVKLTLPSIAIFQMALFDLLVSLGVKPDIVIGHSAGETAVLYASGAATKDLAVEIACARGAALTTIEEHGGSMAALSCGVNEAMTLLEQTRCSSNGVVELACYNSPTAVAISGQLGLIDKVMELAETKGILGRRIKTRVPIHSSMVEPCRKDYIGLIRDIFEHHPGAHKPQIPMYSTLTGKFFDKELDADYLWNTARNPVLFTQAIDSILSSHSNSSLTFIEIAPHPVLSSYLSSMVKETSSVLSTIHRPRNGEPLKEHLCLLQLLGKMTVIGHNCVDFTALNGHSCYDERVTMPPYPFLPKQFPLFPNSDGVTRQMASQHGPLNRKHLKVNKDTHQILAEHVIRGEPIMPAAGYIEMALEFNAPVLLDISMRSILSLSSERPVTVAVELDGSYWSVTSKTSSMAPGGEKLERLHADGYLSYDMPQKDYPKLNLSAIRSRCKTMSGTTDFYSSLQYFSTYGPMFKRVENVVYNSDEALASIKGLDSDLLNDLGYILHPAILDACFHLTAFKAFHGNYDPNAYYLPARVATLVVHQPLTKLLLPSHINAYLKVRKWNPESIQYDISVVDDDGNPICTLESFEVQKHQIHTYPEVLRRFDVLYQPSSHSIRSGNLEPICLPAEDMTGVYISLDDLASGREAESTYRAIDSSVYNNADGVAHKSHVGLPKDGPDKLVIRCCSNNRQAGHEDGVAIDTSKFKCETWNLDWLQKKWPNHSKLLEEQHDISGRSGLPSPHLEYPVVECVQALRDTLCFIAADSRPRIVRLLLAGNSSLVNQRLPSLFSEFPLLYFDYHVSNSNELPDTNPQSTFGRLVEIDFTRPVADQNLAADMFDIVLIFNSLPMAGDRTVSIETFKQLLIPGGTLILNELNADSWQRGAPGTIWFNKAFNDTAGSLTTSMPFKALSMASWLQLLGETALPPVAVYSNDEADPFYFSVVCQKLPDPTISSTYSPMGSDSVVITYRRGFELDLQRVLSGLDPIHRYKIWILATEGPDGDAAKGFTRALRREMLWSSFCLATFHPVFTPEMQMKLLEKIPYFIDREPEILISQDGQILVPRMVTLPAAFKEVAIKPRTKCLPEDHVLIRLMAINDHGSTSGFVGSVVDSRVPIFEEGLLVAGLTGSRTILDHLVTVDAASLVSLTGQAAQSLSKAAACVAGFAIGILAASSGAFRHLDRLQRLRILLTHSNSSIGQSFSRLYGVQSISICEVTDGLGLFELAQLGRERFDLVVSGYTDKAHIQIVRTLLRTQGRMFLWNDAQEGLLAILNKNPWMVGDALHHSFEMMQDRLEEIDLPELAPMSHSSSTQHMASQSLMSFDPNKAYLLLGGVGSLGAPIALWMYNRGARNVILTSRTGRESLHKPSNLMSRRIVNYLEDRADLHLRVEAVDATSADDMKRLVDSITHKLGGCMVLTAVTSDHLFSSMTEEDFTAVFASKVGVFKVLTRIVDVSSLDFLVTFSSASGAFGIAGQTNYSAANTSLDALTAPFPNAFSMIAPGITDSALVLANGTNSADSRLRQVIDWAASSEDLIRWLEDGLCMLRSGQSFQLYIPDLDWEKLDLSLGMTRMGSHLVPPRSLSSITPDDETDMVAQIVMKVLSVSPDELAPELPLTAYGLDSLSASKLSLALESFVEVTQIQLLADLTLEDLRTRTRKATASKEVPITDRNSSASVQNKVAQMHDMLTKYTINLQKHETGLPDNTPPCANQVILLTGPTGALGSNILAKLIDTPTVSRIYAFHRRPSDGKSLLDRQMAVLSAQGYPPSYAESLKLILVEGDLTEPDLGVNHELLEELLSSVTHIMHVAWRVHFLAPLSAFEDLVKGTRRLIDFALRSNLCTPPCLSFVSTIGVYRYPKEAVIAPEEAIQDASVAVETGYIESKWVAERLVQLASTTTTLRTNVIRVGQLTGGPNGCWNTAEWVPTLVKSGLYVGCLPGGDDTIAWLPLHVAAEAIIDMRDAPAGTFHVAHPNPVSWASVMEPLASAIDVPVVSYAEWLSRLEKSLDGSQASQKQEILENPAFKLMDFFRQGYRVSEHLRPIKDSMGLLPKVALEKGKGASPSLCNEQLPKLGNHDVQAWVHYWRDVGFLPSTD